MPTVTQHAVGTFTWPELSTSDQDGAKKFYSGLFGWTFNDIPMGEMGVYTIFLHGGHEVGALTTLMPDLAKKGVPPNWLSYIAVEDVDATTAKVPALGGRVEMGPFDVMDKGRMAVITDPQGATFALWQPKTHHGIGMLGEPGSLGWTQLNANDTAKAKPFYTALVGWRAQDDAIPAEMGGGSYTTWLKADGVAGGMMKMPVQMPSHWLVYWAVANVDESHAKGISLGATSRVPPMDIPTMGRISVLSDPQGATFALVSFKK